MRWLVLALGAVAAVALVVTIVGAALPRTHVAARAARVPASADAVWAALTDVAAYPSWRDDVRAVEQLPPRDGRAAWREDSRHGRITYEVRAATPPASLTTAIADPDLPFGGRWTFTLTPDAGGTRVVVVEDGEVRNPLFRFMSRYVFGHTATMDAYLRALGRKFGADVTPADPAAHDAVLRTAEVPHGT
jgi:uncharacterized protein YndB with AHSA1/START domain